MINIDKLYEATNGGADLFKHYFPSFDPGKSSVLDERGLRGIKADRFYHFVLVFTCVNQIFYTFALSLCETSQTNVGASRAGGR